MGYAARANARSAEAMRLYTPRATCDVLTEADGLEVRLRVRQRDGHERDVFVRVPAKHDDMCSIRAEQVRKP